MATKNTPTNRKHKAHLAVVRQQTQIVTYVAVVAIILALGLVAYGFASNTILLPYRTVATVNGEKLKADEYVQRVKFSRSTTINQVNSAISFYQMLGLDLNSNPNLMNQLNSMVYQLSTAQKLEFGKQILDNYIDETLIRQQAAKMGITVSEAEVEEYLQSNFGYYPNGEPTATLTATPPVFPSVNPTALALITITPTASPAPSEPPTLTPTVDVAATATLVPSSTPTEAPTGTPGPTATPLTADGYQTQVAEVITGFKDDLGLTEVKFRKVLEGALYREKVLAEITKDMKPFEEQVWARHILVTTEAEALAVIDRLNKGEDFGVIAAEVSIDTSNKDTGGDLDWFGHGIMVKEFDEAVFALKVGEISKPIATEFGFHIIQLISKEDRPLTAEEFQQAKEKAFSDWLDQIRLESEIVKFDYWETIAPSEPNLDSLIGN